ncbi:hypothetical protein ACQY0O_001165 [Thecaphora frezii]
MGRSSARITGQFMLSSPRLARQGSTHTSGFGRTPRPRKPHSRPPQRRLCTPSTSLLFSSSLLASTAPTFAQPQRKSAVPPFRTAPHPPLLDSMPPPDSDAAHRELSESFILSFRDGLAPELQAEEWYTILVSLVASCHIGALNIVAIYTVADRLHSTSVADSQRIYTRILETLVKGSVLYGIPSSLETAFTLLSHLRLHQPSSLPASTTPSARGALQSQPLSSLTPRAYEALGLIYQHNLAAIEEKMGHEMEDLKFLALQINYGWNLGEYTVLDVKSTEMAVLAALVAGGWRKEILWHFRGAKRVGWSEEAVRSVREKGVEMASRVGRRVEVPDVDEVKEDSNE